MTQWTPADTTESNVILSSGDVLYSSTYQPISPELREIVNKFNEFDDYLTRDEFRYTSESGEVITHNLVLTKDFQPVLVCISKNNESRQDVNAWFKCSLLAIEAWTKDVTLSKYNINYLLIHPSRPVYSTVYNRAKSVEFGKEVRKLITTLIIKVGIVGFYDKTIFYTPTMLNESLDKSVSEIENENAAQMFLSESKDGVASNIRLAMEYFSDKPEVKTIIEP